jgi:hypothetical protein
MSVCRTVFVLMRELAPRGATHYCFWQCGVTTVSSLYHKQRDLALNTYTGFSIIFCTLLPYLDNNIC